MLVVAPSEAGLGTTAAAATKSGASGLARVDRRILDQNRSPPLVLTMFGGGADREWVLTAMGPQGRRAQKEFKKKMKMKRKIGKGGGGGGFKKEDWANEKSFGSSFLSRKMKRLLV